MAQEGFYLSLDDVLFLRRMKARVESGAEPTLTRHPRNLLPASQVVVGLLTDAIAATTALTSKPKVGTLNVYTFTSTGVEDTGFDEPIYNFAPAIATTDRWTFGIRDSFTGKIILDYQACS